MSTRDEDEAWRAIVENYGDRAVLDDRTDVEPLDVEPGESPARPTRDGYDEDAAAGTQGPEQRPGPAPERETPAAPGEGFVPFGPELSPRGHLDPSASHPFDVPELDDAEDTFVPPDVQLPRMRPTQVAAWIAALGSPVAFVVAALTGVRLGGLLSVILAGCFIGGFAWLVATMPKEPPSPWDDGARV